MNMEWSKFWAENKKEIDKYAKRFMAIDKTEHVVLTITNGGDGIAFLSTDYLPKDPSFGKRLVRIGKKVLLEKVDTEGIIVGENIVLTRWGKLLYSEAFFFFFSSFSSNLFLHIICSSPKVLLRSPRLTAVSKESSIQMAT